MSDRSLTEIAKALLIPGFIIGVFILGLFSVSLMNATFGEIAQSLGNLIGSAIGVLGAFGVAWISLRRENQIRKRQHKNLKSRIKDDLELFSAQLSISIEPFLSGDYTPNHLHVPKLPKLRSRQMDLTLFSDKDLQSYEFLHSSIEYFNDRIYEYTKAITIPLDQRTDSNIATINAMLISLETVRRSTISCCIQYEVKLSSTDEALQKMFTNAILNVITRNAESHLYTCP